MQAGGVPIAVPVSCNHEVSPNLKILLRIRISRPQIVASMVLMPWQSELVLRKFEISESACSVSMFVYIDTASAVKKEVRWGSNENEESCSFKS